jgi:pimeloyl-ACP methyl ester carboxylesterase
MNRAVSLVLITLIAGAPWPAVAQESEIASTTPQEVLSAPGSTFESLIPGSYSGTILFSQDDATITSEPTQEIPSGFDTVQTLGTNLSGTVTRVYIRGVFTPGHPSYGSTGPVVAYFHQCDDAEYSSNCSLLGSAGVAASEGENLLDFDYSASPIVLNPEKYSLVQFQAPWGFSGKRFVFYGSGDSNAYSTGEWGKAVNVSGYPIPELNNGIEDLHFVVTGTSDEPEGGPSNVLFLPGFEGSALVENGNLLWPPSIFSEDVGRLAITETGESVNDVAVAGVLGDFYGTSVYGGFSNFMDGLVADGVINEWLPFSYDWRLPLSKTLEEGVTREGNSQPVLLVEELEELAANSKSGKVVIVGHSMGGLLGKLLVKKLEEEGKEDLVEAFVMVGTPQLGTPQGTAGLLHGDQLGIAGGLFVKAKEAREIAQNMETAYSLMPSAEYFDAVADSPITFDANADFTAEWRSVWGEGIDTFSEHRAFVTGEQVLRTEPDPGNLSAPEIANPEIFDAADSLHQTLDSYVFPENIRVIQIAGWGLPTVKSITYKKKHGIFNGYETSFTVEGDKTVVYPSAISAQNQENYFLNLFEYNDFSTGDFQHRNLLDVEPLEISLESIIKKDPVEITEYITQERPSFGDVDANLLITTRSPVLVGATDNEGRFTGINPQSDIGSEAFKITEEIPGSSFIVSGEDQYLFLPKTGSYNLKFVGTGSGPTTIETADFSNNSTNGIATYTDIPVTSSTEGVFEINAESPEGAIIRIDSNKDGVFDSSVPPDGYVAPPTLAELIANLKTKILSLRVKEKLKEKLLKKIERLEKKIAKQRQIRATKIIMNLEKKIQKKAQKGRISDTDAESILDLLEEIERAL